ncbi:MAG: hypothetical protein BroJett005_21580 [Ignavibacteriota bacterium]|nr:MAG: hypothetical protein BroJett005_21580 [Ignavibacteriota bacterium]
MKNVNEGEYKSEVFNLEQNFTKYLFQLYPNNFKFLVKDWLTTLNTKIILPLIILSTLH